MTDEADARVDKLRKIAAELTILRAGADEAGAGMLAYLLESALHEARAELGRRGVAISDVPVRENDTVVRFRRPP